MTSLRKVSVRIKRDMFSRVPGKDMATIKISSCYCVYDIKGKAIQLIDINNASQSELISNERKSVYSHSTPYPETG